MDGWSTTVTPLIGVVLGVILLDIRSRLKELNGKFFTHVTDAKCHEAGFAKVDEQIKNLLSTVKIAHERVDRIKLHGGPIE